MDYSLSEKAIFLLDSLEGLEYKHKAAILERAGKPENLFDMRIRGGDALTGIMDEAKIKTVFAAFDEDYAEYTLEKYEEAGTVVITRGSENYPESLENISAPPLCLYCNGDVTLLKSKCFAIVGSRKCPPYATALIKEHAEVLAKNGVTVVTGSAGGADKAAIEGSLAGGGKVISVLAGGIKHIYPEYNKNLIKEVSEKGLVVSEHNPFVAPKPWMFPVRNRIIAGLAEGVLIAAGERQSGARHTATFALEYGKEVFAYPYSIGISSGELNNELIKDGASLCDSAD
ncbi:MAG TPA: DNA-protecting protein DprA, partial [Clostridiales bacterium]|nr:DNA-protecting protein DprA [Clostridiales bacterium]